MMQVIMLNIWIQSHWKREVIDTYDCHLEMCFDKEKCTATTSAQITSPTWTQLLIDEKDCESIDQKCAGAFF
jgi:hypothetical protein